jgi:hypothetical protein
MGIYVGGAYLVVLLFAVTVSKHGQALGHALYVVSDSLVGPDQSVIHVSEHRPIVFSLPLSGLVGERPKESASADKGLEVAAQWTSHVTKKVRNNTAFPSDPFHKWAKGRVALLRIDQGGYGNHKSNFNSEGSFTP